MKGRDLVIFRIIAIISAILGFYAIGNSFDYYMAIIVYVSISVWSEIMLLAIIFDTPLKKILYGMRNKDYGTELHKLKNFFSFSMRIGIISILMIIIIPEFCFQIYGSHALSKSIIVLPILCCHSYCLSRLFGHLLKIFVYPVNY